MNFLPLFIQNPKCASHSKWCHLIQNDVIKCCKMMSSNVALLHSNNCCVLEPAICEDLDLHVVIVFTFPITHCNEPRPLPSLPGQQTCSNRLTVIYLFHNCNEKCIYLSENEVWSFEMKKVKPGRNDEPGLITFQQYLTNLYLSC